MPVSKDFPSVDHIAVGAIGEPGKRIFLFQARYLGDIITLKIEKAQVAALSQHLGELLKELPRPGHIDDPSEIILPYEIAWSVGTIAIAYSEENDQIQLHLEALAESEDDASTLTVGLSREQSVAIAVQGTRMVEAGRPPCPLCGYPLDPSGHACPKTNGYRAPTL